MILNQFKGRSGIFLLRTLQGSAKNAFKYLFPSGRCLAWLSPQSVFIFIRDNNSRRNRSGSPGSRTRQRPPLRPRPLQRSSRGPTPWARPWGPSPCWWRRWTGPEQPCSSRSNAAWTAPRPPQALSGQCVSSMRMSQQRPLSTRQRSAEATASTWAWTGMVTLTVLPPVYILYSDWHMACPLDIFLANQG